MSFFKKISHPIFNLFKKGSSQKSSNKFFSKNSNDGLGLNLKNVIQNSYNPKNNLDGFIKDEELSGKRQQVYVNPENNKLLMTVAGTRSGTDIYNDFRLATGGIKNTNRFKSADNTLNLAKQKYPEYDNSIIGHSLGGAIASRIGGSDDNIITYNAGEVGRKNRPNVTALRNSGDVISMFGASKSQSVGSPSWNLLQNHKSDSLGDNFFI